MMRKSPTRDLWILSSVFERNIGEIYHRVRSSGLCPEINKKMKDGI